MKKVIFLSLFSALLLLGYNANAQQNAGGFVGPTVEMVSVAQANGMQDDAVVVMQGNIIKNLGKEKYQFQDAAGDIVIIEIDDDDWNGQTVTPQETIEIVGEVDKDWSGMVIDVQSFKKVNK